MVNKHTIYSIFSAQKLNTNIDFIYHATKIITQLFTYIFFAGYN